MMMTRMAIMAMMMAKESNNRTTLATMTRTTTTTTTKSRSCCKRKKNRCKNARHRSGCKDSRDSNPRMVVGYGLPLHLHHHNINWNLPIAVTMTTRKILGGVQTVIQFRRRHLRQNSNDNTDVRLSILFHQSNTMGSNSNTGDSNRIHSKCNKMST